MNLVQPHFENIKGEILDQISTAKSSIFVAVAWFTDHEIIDILADKASMGVSVDVLISKDDKNALDRFYRLIEAGGDVYASGGVDFKSTDFMHNKFCVIDYTIFITGSYNWTANAVSNQENIIVGNNAITSSLFLDQGWKLLKKADPIVFDSLGNINVKFTASKRLVSKDESVELIWKVENAETIEISSIGQNLDFTGSHSIKLRETRRFKLVAKYDNSIKTKEIQLRVKEDAEIDFFLSSAESILRGQSLSLRWRVVKAAKVFIEPNLGEQDFEGSLEVIPSSDTLYQLKVIGETGVISQSLRVMVYNHPTIEMIDVPTPTEIELHAFIDISTTKIPTNISIEEPSKIKLHKFPKIGSLNGSLNRTKVLKEFSSSLGKEIHELNLPRKVKNSQQKGIKSKILDGLDRLYKDNVKAKQIISQIRKTYEL